MNNFEEESFKLVLFEEIDQELIDILKSITSIDCPENDNIIDWSGLLDCKATFKYKDCFVKLFYECRHAQRKSPFINIFNELNIIEKFNNNGIPIPKMLGCFSTRDNEENWTVNGIVFENLIGYDTFENSPDYGMIEEILNFLAEKGICNSDFHLNNIMKKGNDWKIIDFDMVEFIENKIECFNKMAKRCIEVAECKNLPIKDEVKERLTEMMK